MLPFSAPRPSGKMNNIQSWSENINIYQRKGRSCCTITISKIKYHLGRPVNTGQLQQRNSVEIRNKFDLRGNIDFSHYDGYLPENWMQSLIFDRSDLTLSQSDWNIMWDYLNLSMTRNNGALQRKILETAPARIVRSQSYNIINVDLSCNGSHQQLKSASAGSRR